MRLALGQTVKEAIEGDGKVERLITDTKLSMWIWLSLHGWFPSKHKPC